MDRTRFGLMEKEWNAKGKDAQIAAIASSRGQAMSLLRSEIEFH